MPEMMMARMGKFGERNEDGGAIARKSEKVRERWVIIVVVANMVLVRRLILGACNRWVGCYIYLYN
jgi:hypothetical protein